MVYQLQWSDYVVMIVTSSLIYLFIKYCTEAFLKRNRQLPPVDEPDHEEEIVETVTSASRPVGNSILNLLELDDVEKIFEKVDSINDVTDLLKKAGLDSVNLVFGIDYTASNYRQGMKTFGGKSLHDVNGPELNPYQKVISTLGQTLEPLSQSGTIPAFGFGDSTTRDVSIFPLRDKKQHENGDCKGFKEVLQRYNKLTPTLRLSGPTNFAPLIRQTISIVKNTKSYHILVIVADGQVTREIDTRKTIIDASQYPLSIIMIGVGDGPWDDMDEYDDQLPERKFDNFHFVDYHKVCNMGGNSDAAFAIQAFIEIPDQYKSICQLGYLG